MPSKFGPKRPAQVMRSDCRQCRRPPPDGERLSARLLCRECAEHNMTATARELQERRGPHYEEWARRSLEAAQRAVASIS